MNRRERRRLSKGHAPDRAAEDIEAAAAIERIITEEPGFMLALERQDPEVAAMIARIREAPYQPPAEPIPRMDSDRLLAALAAATRMSKAAVDRIHAKEGRPEET